jgi:hypothetical protein
MTLGAVLYNLIADVVGGVELAVLEETYNVAPITTTQARSRPGQTQGNGHATTQQRARPPART